ncbi:Golgi to ER traffic protein 4 [Balamuthia mandrillaris]
MEAPKKPTTRQSTKKGLSRLQKKMEEGNFYEAQQLVKLLLHRFSSQKNLSEAENILLSGMDSMLAHQQHRNASELGLLLVKLYSENHVALAEEKKALLLAQYEKYPPEVDEGKVEFLKAAIKYSTKAESNSNTPNGEPRFHNALASYFFHVTKDWGQAQRHFVRSGNPQGFTEMLLAAAEEGGNLEVEDDLFLARAVLQYLCLSNWKDAITLFQLYCASHPAAATSPLSNFIRFLLATVQHRTAGATFQTLRTKYKPSIQRDPTFEQYLDRIGEIFFGIKPQTQAGGLGGLLNGFLQAFLSPEENEGSSS